MIKINNIEYNGNLLKGDGNITFIFDDTFTDNNINDVKDATSIEEYENNTLINTYALVHWKSISKNEDNLITIAWQTHFEDDIAMLQGQIEDIANYYHVIQETKIEDIERRMNRYDLELSNLQVQINSIITEMHTEPETIEPEGEY